MQNYPPALQKPYLKIQRVPPKYLQKIFAIPKCYTILESWEQMPQHGFDKNLIWRNFFFNIQRGDPLDLQKRFLQCGGVILHEKKFCKTRSSSNMSKNALLSASGWNPKLHNYHPRLVWKGTLHSPSYNTFHGHGNWSPPTLDIC